MNEVLVENAQHYYDLRRKKTEFKRNNIKMVYNVETLTISGPRIWETVLGYI